VSPVKEEAIKLIQLLPDDCSMEDIHYHLYLREKVTRALANLDDGKDLTHEEAEKRASQWLKSYGKTICTTGLL
jgi:hypothetical protein